MILDPELRTKCIYFPGDTFYFRPTVKGKDGKMQPIASADAQVTHAWLGHVLLSTGSGFCPASREEDCRRGTLIRTRRAIRARRAPVSMR